MKRRLLAILLSIAMLTGSVPVYAAEPGGGMPAANEEEASVKEASVAEASAAEGAAEQASPDTQEGENADKSGNREETGAAESAPAKESSESSSLNPEPPAAETAASETIADEPESKSENSQNTDSSTDESTAESEENIDSIADETVESEEFSTDAPEEETKYSEKLRSQTASPVSIGSSTVTLLPSPGGAEYAPAVWQSFTAPRDGYYSFKAVNPGLGEKINIEISLHSEIDGEAIRRTSGSYPGSLTSDFMRTGETIYIKLRRTDWNYDITADVTFKVAEIASYAATSTGNGSYSFNTGDYTLSVTAKAGYKTLIVDAQMSKPSDVSPVYVLKIYYRQKNGASQNFADQNDTNSILFMFDYGDAPDRSGQRQMTKDITPDTEYELYFVMMKDKKGDRIEGADAVAVFKSEPAISMKTMKLTTDAAAMMHGDPVAKPNSITLDMEFFQDRGTCYIVRADEPAADEDIAHPDVSGESGKGRGLYTFKGLLPKTKYKIRFEYDRKTLFEIEASTLDSGLEVSHTVKWGTKEDEINVAPTLETVIYGYTGDDLTIIHEFTDDMGIKHAVWAGTGRTGGDITQVTSAEDPNKKGVKVSCRIRGRYNNPVLLQDKEYPVTVQVRVGKNENETMPYKETVMVSTAGKGLDAAAITDIKATPGVTAASGSEEQNGGDGSVECSIETSDNSKLSGLNVGVFYKRIDDFGYTESDKIWYSSSAAHTIEGLDKGAEYKFCFVAGGRIIEKNVKINGMPDVILERVESETDAVNAFDIVHTFKVKEGAKNLMSEYELWLYYLDGTEYKSLAAVKLNARNKYQAEVKTTSSDNPLKPNSEYKFKWVLQYENSPLPGAIYESVKTKMPDVAVNTREIKLDEESPELHFTATIDKTQVTNFSSFTGKRLETYIRKKGNAGYTQAGYIDLYGYQGEDVTGRTAMSGLDPGVTYDFSLRFLGVEVKNFQYTMLSDRQLSTGSPTGVSYTRATVPFTLSENNHNKNTSIYGFYRKQGSTGGWTKAYDSKSTSDVSYSGSIDFTELEHNTDYDYIITLGTEQPDASTAKTGSFKTKEFKCTLSFTLVESAITQNSATYRVQAVPEDAGLDSLELYLNLQNADGMNVNGRTATLTNSSGYSADVVFNSLKVGTAYTLKTRIILLEKPGSLDITYPDYPIKFMGPKVDPPTAIRLSADTIYLNATYGSGWTAVEGLNKMQLAAAIEPATAAKNLIWSSGDTAVAVVSDSGMVTAVGKGTAIITATSLHDDAIKATCTVNVEKYAAGYKPNDDAPLKFAESVTLTRGGTLAGISLYDCSTATPTELTGYAAELAGSDIASFDAQTKILKGVKTGTVYITFKKGEYKARLKVNVTPAAKGFGVASVSNSYYPAVKNADGSYILAYKPADSKDQSDGTYKVNLEIAPKGSGTVNEGDFTWTSDKTDVASVSGQGVITPLNPGDVTLTIKRKDESYENVNEAKVKLSIKAMPDMDGSKDTISVLTNPELDIKKLSDVEFPAGWEEGWQWKEPDAPLVTNGADANASCRFEAVYSKDGKYPMEAKLTVKIGKVTGVRIEADNRGNEAGLHNHVLKTEKDELALSVSAAAQGSVSASDYTTGIPDVDGLAITSAGNNTFKIKADRPGSYTLTPSIYAAGTDKVLAKTAYKITAVSDKVAASVSLSTDTEGVSISGGMISFDDAAKTDFNLTAEALDQDRQPIDPYSFVWKTTDKSVAKVTLPERGKSGRAKIEIKGSGHAVLTAVASDKRQASASIRLEVKDHAPRVDTGRASVNIAYDYAAEDGRMLAAEAGGAVEIVPVYAGDIERVELREEGSETPSDRLEAQYNSGYSYIIQPTAAALAEASSDKLEKGTYKCRLLVTTRGSRKPYEYGLTVKVTDSKPKVTAKMGAAPNLFYTYTTGTISLSISGKERLNSTVRWTDSDAQNTGNGFAMGSISYDAKGKPYIRITQQAGLAVNTETGKLAPEAVAQGSLYIKLSAYREEYTFKDFQIKYSYKKPAMVTKNAQTAIVPAAGKRDSSFYVYNNTEKRYAYYMDRENYNEDYSYDIYSSVTADDKDVTLAPIDNSVLSCRYSYAGDEKSHDFTLTLDSPWWREPLTASHTVNITEPSAYLEYNAVTLNTALRSDIYSRVYLNGTSRSDMPEFFSKFDIEGADEKSKELLAKDYLVMTSSGNVIKAEQNRAEFMNAGGATIPAGTYSFNVKPYYYDNGSKKNVELNTLAFKVNVINSAVTAKVSPKGSLDLTYGMGSMPYDKKNVCVLAEPEFKNLSSGYGVRSCRLTGEYSEYFSLIRNRNSTIRYGGKWIYSDYIYVNTAGKLKAGQAYRLAIEYTLANAEGQEIKVTSNTFTIKPKQTLPKISVSGNNQILYAGAAGLSRTCTLSLPGEYRIDSASGSLDVNKDGSPDISATGAGYDNGRYRITLSIADKDAITASSGGTGYSIPITVRLRGRDGISKDAAVTIKVKVKR